MQTGARKTAGAGSANTAAPQRSNSRRASAGASPSRFKVTDWPEVNDDPAKDQEAAHATSPKPNHDGSSPALGFKDFVWPESSTSLDNR
jgi:hypothetical protein